MRIKIIFELAQICNAVFGTLANDAGCDPDDFKRDLLFMLQDDGFNVEFMGNEPGTLHVFSN